MPNYGTKEYLKQAKAKAKKIGVDVKYRNKKGTKSYYADKILW